MDARHRKKLTLLSVTAMMLWFTAIQQLSAQVISGDLVGTVLDRSAAVVPGARVEATRTDTGVKYETKANENGEYRFNNLPVGIYSVSASALNFATSTVNSTAVELNKTSTLQITLEVKGAMTTVEVSGAPATLDTTTAQLQSTFEAKDLGDSALTVSGGTEVGC
jgi:Carboxypeptidase regulatory-like domain